MPEHNNKTLDNSKTEIYIPLALASTSFERYGKKELKNYPPYRSSIQMTWKQEKRYNQLTLFR